MKVNKAMVLAKERAKQKNIELRNIEIKRLIIYVLQISAAEFVITRRELSINKEQENQFFKYVDEIISGKPLQYITHSQHIMGLDFYVDENVLIPQMDTEVLIEQAIDIINENVFTNKIKVLDLCTGSGAIAISLKKKLKDRIEITATDISRKALEVAKINTKKLLGDADKIEFIQSDMFENIDGKFDIIVSNPPYIETDTIKELPLDVQNEPHIALDGGKDGLDFYRIIKENLDDFINKNGYLIMEIGYNQKDSLYKLFPGSKCIKDFADNDRVIVYQCK